MMNSKALFHDLVQKITLPEQKEEIQSVVYLFLHHLTGLTRTEILSEKKVELTASQKNTLNDFIKRINSHEPVQYIVGETEFYGRTFKVRPGVLIPRPETEELVKLSLGLMPTQPSRVLDIGTGSGCIPISFKLERPDCIVFAIDVSDIALRTATENAQSLQAQVSFLQADILKDGLPVVDLDLVVSNPPYITQSEKSAMDKNVLDHEPSLALFVPDDDPLLFYRDIARKAFNVLNKNGILVTEINERFGKQVADLFSDLGYKDVHVAKDMFGKDRIVYGRKY